ncbi:MAG: glucuronate isomerase [Actinobacteria bacterium HGW-Actinobacteria-4]|nr:MAG: glucuronate isomerase [Actinobacteria bacterium HGW-Actinobacteria-4]
MSPRDPDRLLPSDPATRAIARDLYRAVADAPIVSPHGHVPAASILDDAPFPDPAQLLVTSDHYVTRLIHAHGVSLDHLGLGPNPAEPRDVWRAFASHWHAFAGTASGYWLADTFATLFGIGDDLDAASADAAFDAVADVLAKPGFRPRALFERFAIEVLATTDDPLDALDAHAALAADASFSGRVIPTFRPDRFLDATQPGFAAAAAALLDATGAPASTLEHYLDSLRARREHFIAHGATSADHGMLEPFAIALEPATAETLFQSALGGTLEPADARALHGHLLVESARMSVEDGLVMTIHPGVRRGHHAPTAERYGPDTGHDIPVRTEYTENLRPLLEAFGTEPGFHLVLFTVDETTFSRELAPLAGFYPSVYVGAPWWFLDAPDAMARFRSAVTETAGFYRTSGFIDDTRAFLSIPARHDAARRVDAGFLARMVREGRVSLDAAQRIAHDLVDAIPRHVFKL